MIVVSGMTVLWFVAIASMALALLAWRRARATARRLEQLSQMYWELRYQHGELRVQVQRLSPAPPSDGREPARPGEASTPGFVPLSSLKRGAT